MKTVGLYGFRNRNASIPANPQRAMAYFLVRCGRICGDFCVLLQNPDNLLLNPSLVPGGSWGSFLPHAHVVDPTVGVLSD
jgi:hypothetical protein